jgi:ABC-2 type transport system ATP-binding protein
LHNPQLLILDEPFSGFDPVNADLIKDLIIELKNQGTSIIFSTHRMDNVESLCDHLAIIHQGEKVLDGGVSDIRRKYAKGIYEVGYYQSVEWDAGMSAAGESTLISEQQQSDGKVVYRFQTSESFTPEQLLKLAMGKGNLVHFSEHVPSIHEIFVDTVSKTAEPIAGATIAAEPS